MNLDDYITGLCDRFNSPTYPRLPQALDGVQGISSVREAWEQLRLRQMLMPLRENDSQRMFAANIDGQLIMPKDRPPEYPHPATLNGVLTVAADPEGFLNAERHARELARRLSPWTAVCDNKVVWYFTDNPYHHHPFESTYLGLAFSSALDTVNWTLLKKNIDIQTLAQDQRLSTLPSLVRKTVAAWNGWNAAVNMEMDIVEPRWPLDLSKWRLFSDLKNPFTPLLDLWCCGYRYAGHLDSSDPTIRLYAKPITMTAIN